MVYVLFEYIDDHHSCPECNVIDESSYSVKDICDDYVELYNEFNNDQYKLCIYTMEVK